MYWEQSPPIVSSKRNPPLNLNLSMTGNYKCSNNYIELTLYYIVPSQNLYTTYSLIYLRILFPILGFDNIDGNIFSLNTLCTNG